VRKLLLCGLALACLPSLARAEPKPSIIPLADFAALPVLSKPLLSPDGRRIAARHTADGKTSIAILDADHPGVTIRAIPLGKGHVYSLVWAGNNRLLLTVLTIGNVNGFQFPFLRLIAIDVATSFSRVVDNKSRGLYAGDVIYADPSGDWALVAGQDYVDTFPSVKRVDLNTGQATVIEKPRDDVWDWFADDHGVVRAGVAYDQRHWKLWYRDKPDEKLRAIKGKFDKPNDSAVDRFIFRGDKSWIVTNERTGRFGLYKFDPGSGTVGEPIYENAEVDIDDPVYDPVTGEISAVPYEDDRHHSNWLDPELKALQTKLDRALPNSVNITVDMTADKKHVLVWSASASDPGRYYLLDRTASEMHAVVDPYPRIDPTSLAEVKAVRYEARDGLSLRAYLTLPKGREAKNLPLIVFPHGGPFERDHWEYDPWVQFLANRGYAVLQPEFRGSTGFGKDLVEKGYGEWGRKMQDDIDDGVDWLARIGQIDTHRVCIVGASYGGYAAIWAAVRNPERYRCAASMAGVSDVPAMLSYDKKTFSAPRYFREWRSHVGGETNVDLAAVSPINFVGRIRTPLLIGHGEQDTNVPSSQSHKLVDALTKAGANVTSVFYKEGGHGFDSSADLQDWLARLEAFLTKYNPA
jgi:dipeptidyl aminopeptidase/acylaminoacyl peptidase